MNSYPTELKLADDGSLLIQWSDGQARTYGLRELRDGCPCATCREKHSVSPPAGQLPVLTNAEIQPLLIKAMKPVGNYAYSIEWSDGHDTGIYTFELLLALGS